MKKRRPYITFLFFSIFFLNGCFGGPSQERFPNPEGEPVVVLHGILRTNKAMYKIAKRISDAGYDVYNFSYPSRDYTLEELAEYIDERIQENGLYEKEKVNIVAHSLGGLIVRSYLNLKPMDNVGNVVMICTPNKGSQIADGVRNSGLFKKIFGKAGQQLITDQQGMSCLSGIVYYDLGIIAGTKSFNPIFSSLLPGKDDGIVAVEHTKLEGMKDHITIPSLHGAILRRKDTAEQTIHFLQNSEFKRKDPGAVKRKLLEDYEEPLYERIPRDKSCE